MTGDLKQERKSEQTDSEPNKHKIFDCLNRPLLGMGGSKAMSDLLVTAISEYKGDQKNDIYTKALTLSDRFSAIQTRINEAFSGKNPDMAKRLSILTSAEIDLPPLF